MNFCKYFNVKYVISSPFTSRNICHVIIVDVGYIQSALGQHPKTPRRSNPTDCTKTRGSANPPMFPLWLTKFNIRLCIFFRSPQSLVTFQVINASHSTPTYTIHFIISFQTCVYPPTMIICWKTKQLSSLSVVLSHLVWWSYLLPLCVTRCSVKTKSHPHSPIRFLQFFSYHLKFQSGILPICLVVLYAHDSLISI